MHVLLVLTVSIIIFFQDAISLKKQKRHEIISAENDIPERISYSDELYAPFKPGKEFKSKPDIKNPGSCNRFLLIPETSNSSMEVRTEPKHKKSTERNQLAKTSIIDGSSDKQKSLFLTKQTDESRTNEEMKVVYRKLAEDFQVLQKLLENEKHSINGNVPAETQDQNFIQEPKLNDDNASKVLTIEDVNSNTGPLTRITLLRRNVVAKKSDLDLPVVSSKGNVLKDKHVNLEFKKI